MSYPRLIIPTRNRSTALAGVIRWLEDFYPQTPVVIADGSSPSHAQRNRATVDNSSLPRIDYHLYDESLGFFDRIHDVISRYDDLWFVMGSDDDFPLMDEFSSGAEFLGDNLDYVSYVGPIVNLELKTPDAYHVRMNHCRSIENSDPVARMKAYALWPFPTTYALTRREVLLKRYQRATRLAQASFVDFMVGVFDAIDGKIKSAPSFAYVCTRNYNHSYLRAPDSLLFLRESDTVLDIRSEFSRDLQDSHGVVAREADAVATVMINRRIVEMVGGWAPQRRGFLEGPVFNSLSIQQQLKDFDALFQQGTEVRARYDTRLMAISNQIHANAVSDDNDGEPREYENLDVIATGDAGKKSACVEANDVEEAKKTSELKRKKVNPDDPRSYFVKHVDPVSLLETPA